MRPLASRPCTYDQLTSPEFLEWAERLRPAWDLDRTGGAVLVHRKLWEWLFICVALDHHAMLRAGRRGLGFGVGSEPLVAAFAGNGCRIVATDLPADEARQSGWARPGGEFAGHLDGLFREGLCGRAEFDRGVEYRSVDMHDIPDDLRGFDFTWSSCAFEHLGSIDAGVEFLLRQMDCLRPGGVAVHTTEMNVESDDETIEGGGTVLFRRRDLAGAAEALRRRGHRVRLRFGTGDRPEDLHVETEPFTTTHLKVRFGGHVTTSYGLVVTKAARPAPTLRRWLARSPSRPSGAR